jgi:hypothetical protein
MRPPFNYAVALSFAGEDRGLASYLAHGLRSDQISVFFDEFEKVGLWGADLSETLPAKYRDARYCVILQSDEYLEKAWTTLERQSIIYEFLSRRGKDYLLPIRVRGCTRLIPGLSELTGFITIDGEDDWPAAIALLKAKLEM